MEFLREADYGNWDAFVENSERGTIFHTTAWKKVIESTFGYTPLYAVFRNKQNEISGVLPSFVARSISGNILVSQPFAEYGGPVFKDEKGLPRDILDTCRTLGAEAHCAYVEIKCPPDSGYPCAEERGFTKVLKAYDYHVRIPGKDFYSDFWMKLSAKERVRNSVRHAFNSGVRIAQSDDMRIFYSLYLKSIARLGSLPWPKQFFVNIEKYVPSARFTMAYAHGKAIAAMMSLPYRNRDLAVVLAYDDAYQQLRASDFLYYHEIKFAFEHNFAVVDLGRTQPGSSYERYKGKWGSVRSDLYSYVYPASAAQKANPYALYSRFSPLTRNNFLWSIFVKTAAGQNAMRYFP